MVPAKLILTTLSYGWLRPAHGLVRRLRTLVLGGFIHVPIRTLLYVDSVKSK
jgi:hypothetical protein